MNKHNVNKSKYLKIESKRIIEENKYTYRRKGGFTLIEVIVVIAMLGIVAAALLPKLSGYITEAKKMNVVEQSRKVIMAVESYNMKAASPIAKTSKISDVIAINGVKKYFEDPAKGRDKLTDGMTLEQCYQIVEGGEFSIDSGGKYSKMGID